MNKDLKKRLPNLPDSPGIYKMIDEEGRVIYIGKAKSLKKRVKQYFQKGYEHSTRTKKLLEKLETIETIAVDSELEAMILESNLIKQLQPKYNILLKDDKNFVYIKITKEDFPRIKIVRQIEKDGAKYFGPKTAAHKVKTTLKILKKIFPFRHCSLDIEMLAESKSQEDDHKVKVTNKVIKYPCLDYFIKKCAAPCIGKCTPEEYQEIIKSVEEFLSGKTDTIFQNLQEKMRKHAANKEFEKAAKIRDKIKTIESILEKQKVASANETDKDIINYCITRENAYFNLFQVRDNQLIGQENFTLSAKEVQEETDMEVLEAFLKQYYEVATDVGKEILIPHAINNQEELESYLTENHSKKIQIEIPQIGKKNKLLEMSLNNARIYADRNKPSWQEESELTIEASKELQKTLNIPHELKRIECYDISHLSGTETVGSMIVFQNGAPKNKLYRKFKIRTLTGKPDDYKSLEEVLTRRFQKITETLNLQDHKFRKAKKKDQKNFEKLDQEEFTQLYLIEKEEKILASATIKEHSLKVAQINNFSGKDAVGYKLLRMISQKTKAKRIYIAINPTQKDYFLKFGFEEIKKMPEEVKLRKGQIILALDRIKLKEDESFKQIPDLVIIDGGKGQLAMGTKVFKQLNITTIPYISLAKRLEEIFVPGQQSSILLEKNNEALKLLQRARDEAHRFAISFNRDLRSKQYKRKN